MNQDELKLSFDSEKMEALVFYLKKENTTVQKKMDKALRLLYEQAVPEPVREYLDARLAPARPKRPARTSQPKTASPKPPPVSAGDEKETGV